MATFVFFLVPRCKAKVDLAFIVDSSGSISTTNWIRMKEFLKSVVNEFNVADKWTHVAVIAYSTNPKVVLRFNDLKGSALTAAAVNTRIDGMKHQRGLTFIDKALRKAQESVFRTYYGMREDVTKVLYFF